MNLELLESFGQNFPEDFDGTLDCMSVAITCQFNRRGTLLAVGCNDGRIFVWDFLTRGIAKIINAHVHPVCSLSWNRTGHNLLSASTDNTVCIWNVITGDCLRKYRFPSPFLKVQFNPRNNGVFLVCPLKHPSLLVNLDGKHYELPLDDQNEPNVISTFDRRGEHVFCGNAKGKVSVFKADTREFVTSFRVTSSQSSSTSAIRQIEFARRGTNFLVSTADRIIRVYDTLDILPSATLASQKNQQNRLSDPEPLQKLQDLVNRTLWKKCCFSGDGEYICAGSSRQHSLYIWEKNIGNLVKILHGTKGEMLLDVVWHPVRPLIASVSSGVVSIWSQNQVENWSAFAPDFKELDENVEYEERESEYDLEDEDKSVQGSKCKEEEEVEADVTTIQPIQAFLSSDEEDENDQLLFLTITPEFDEVDEVAPATTSMNDMPPPFVQTKNPPINTTLCYDIEMPNAPVNEIHPFNVGVKRQNSNTTSAPKSETAKPSLNSKRSKSNSSKNNSKKSKQQTAGDEDDELMAAEASNSNDATETKGFNEQAGGESSSNELDSVHKMEENPAAIESSRTDSIDSTSSMLNQNMESARDSLNSLSNTPTNNTPTQHFNQND